MYNSNETENNTFFLLPASRLVTLTIGDERETFTYRRNVALEMLTLQFIKSPFVVLGALQDSRNPLVVTFEISTFVTFSEPKTKRFDGACKVTIEARGSYEKQF